MTIAAPSLSVNVPEIKVATSMNVNAPRISVQPVAVQIGLPSMSLNVSGTSSVQVGIDQKGAVVSPNDSPMDPESFDYLTKKCIKNQEETLKWSKIVFAQIDSDNDGYIDDQEVKAMLVKFCAYMQSKGSKINVNDMAALLSKQWLS